MQGAVVREIPRKTALCRDSVDVDFMQTATGRVSFYLCMAKFARAGEHLGATTCAIALISAPETKQLGFECTFEGCGTWDIFYPGVTADDKRTFYLDMIMTALEQHRNHPSLARLWGPGPFLAKNDIAEKLAALRLDEK